MMSRHIVLPIWIHYPSLFMFPHSECSSSVCRSGRNRGRADRMMPSSWGCQAFSSSCHCAWDCSPHVRGPHPVTVGPEYWDQETWTLVLALSLVLTFHVYKVMAFNLVTKKFCTSPTSSESDGELQDNCMIWLALGPDWPMPFLS